MQNKKLFEANGKQSAYPLELDIVKSNGDFEDYYLISRDVKDKITLGDMVNEQVNIINIETAQGSGDYAQNANSGDNAKNASSGYNAKNASSGDYAKNVTEGKYSVTMACGFLSSIRAINGTWISLCEYSLERIDGKEVYIPTYAASAQIGNLEYIDVNGNVLSENEHYVLYNRKFQPVVHADGILCLKIKSRKVGEVMLHTCMKPYTENEKVYIAELNEIYAHGLKPKQALSDLQYKILSSMSVTEHVARIKETGTVSRQDYRLITGACEYGIEQFCKDKNIEDVQELTIAELLEILDSKYYGANKFRELFAEAGIKDDN